MAESCELGTWNFVPILLDRDLVAPQGLSFQSQQACVCLFPGSALNPTLPFSIFDPLLC